METKLTNRIVEAALPAEKYYFIWDAGDGAVKGFGLKVNPNGKKVFVAQFRIGSGRSATLRRAFHAECAVETAKYCVDGRLVSVSCFGRHDRVTARLDLGGNGANGACDPRNEVVDFAYKQHLAECAQGSCRPFPAHGSG